MTRQNNNSDTKWIGAGVIAALTASLCCIIPVVAFLAGFVGLGSMFSWVEPYRPYLIGLSLSLLGFAWYQKLRPQWDPNCDCDETFSIWHSKSFLGIMTVIAVTLLTFPYYSDVFFPTHKQNAVNVQKRQVKTITLNIEGMTCSGCESTVKNAALRVNGVVEAKASHSNGEATVKYDRSQTTQEAIKTAINKTGFTVKNIR